MICELAAPLFECLNMVRTGLLNVGLVVSLVGMLFSIFYCVYLGLRWLIGTGGAHD